MTFVYSKTKVKIRLILSNGVQIDDRQKISRNKNHSITEKAQFNRLKGAFSTKRYLFYLLL